MMAEHGSAGAAVCLAALSVLATSCKNNPLQLTRDASDATAPGADGAREGADEYQPLGHCVPGGPGQCSAGSTCVHGCMNRLLDPGGVCSVPGRELCACGFIPSPCTTPGLVCLTCCDSGDGLCVTPAEKADICAGPDAKRFDCAL